MRLQNVIDGVEPESPKELEIKPTLNTVNMNYLMMLKRSIDELDPVEQVEPVEQVDPVDPAEQVEQVDPAEQVEPVDKLKTDYPVKPAVDNDLTKLLLVLNAVIVSASFLQTNSSNKTNLTESSKAALASLN